VRGEVAAGIAAEVERLPVDLLRHVLREHEVPVGGVDLSAVDTELRDADERVVLPRLEPRRGPRLPVRRSDDERRDQHDRRAGEPRDLFVHCHGSSPRFAFARFEMSISPASRTKLPRTLDPP
jgi:hypothetical protein